MITMGRAFSPQADLGAVDDFINTAYELPDFQGVSRHIYDSVTDYLVENLPLLVIDPTRGPNDDGNRALDDEAVQ